jgi:hypothetical protein
MYVGIVENNAFAVSATHSLIIKCCVIDQPGAIVAGLCLIVCNALQDQCFPNQLSVSLIGEQNKTGVKSLLDNVQIPSDGTLLDNVQIPSDGTLLDNVQIPSDGTDVWEIDTSQLKVENKVASGSYGDL